MGYFPVRYDSRVVIYERKMFIRWATGLVNFFCSVPPELMDGKVAPYFCGGQLVN